VKKESELIDRAKAFVAAVAAGCPRETVEAFYAEDIVQEEFPNLLLPKGAVRDFINLRAAHDRSRHSISSQSHEVVNAIASGNTVVLETRWTATLAAGTGSHGEGDRTQARVAQFFEFRNGLIFRIRSYDCFDPW
jgi:ketosteroid isomerase-like protein